MSNVSIEFLLQVFGVDKVKNEGKEEWMKAVRANLKPPTVAIQNFSGDLVTR